MKLIWTIFRDLGNERKKVKNVTLKTQSPVLKRSIFQLFLNIFWLWKKYFFDHLSPSYHAVQIIGYYPIYQRPSNSPSVTPTCWPASFWSSASGRLPPDRIGSSHQLQCMIFNSVKMKYKYGEYNIIFMVISKSMFCWKLLLVLK